MLLLAIANALDFKEDDFYVCPHQDSLIMNGNTLIIILISVCISVLAQVAFKYGVSSPYVRAGLEAGGPLRTVLAFATAPAILGGLVLYGIGTVLWLTALAKTELSQAYPFVGLGFILTAILGSVLFDDTLGPVRLLGIAVVIVGIVLVAKS
jgi:multidrug transporter EmrE-like cation transporter